MICFDTLQPSSNGEENIISNYQLGQRARRERERSEGPPIQLRFFPGLILSRRQQAQTQLAGNKKSRVQSSPVSLEIGEFLPTNILGSSSVSTIPQEAIMVQPEQFSKEKEKTICSLESPSLPNIFQSTSTHGCSTIFSELASNQFMHASILESSSVSTIHQQVTITQPEPSCKVNRTDQLLSTVINNIILQVSSIYSQKYLPIFFIGDQ